jgi:hypothetical protein
LIISEIISGQVAEIISIALNGLTHHVVSESVVVRVLESCLLIMFVVVAVISSNFLLEKFKLSSI